MHLRTRVGSSTHLPSGWAPCLRSRWQLHRPPGEGAPSRDCFSPPELRARRSILCPGDPPSQLTQPAPAAGEWWVVCGLQLSERNSSLCGSPRYRCHTAWHLLKRDAPLGRSFVGGTYRFPRLRCLRDVLGSTLSIFLTGPTSMRQVPTSLCLILYFSQPQRALSRGLPNAFMFPSLCSAAYPWSSCAQGQGQGTIRATLSALLREAAATMLHC